MSLSSSLPSTHKVVPIVAPRSRCSPKDFTNLLNLGPLSVLYPHLIPPKKKTLKKEKEVLKKRLKPPLIHCGFVADEEFLFAYARIHGLLRECPGEREGEMILMELVTMTAAVKAIFKELGISSIPVRLPGVVTKNDVIRVIALCNNYSMKNVPPDGDVRKLARFLGQEEQPKWYFDCTHWRWNQEREHRCCSCIRP